MPFVSAPTVTVNLSGFTSVVDVPEVETVELGCVSLFVDCAVALISWVPENVAANIPAASIPVSRTNLLLLVDILVLWVKRHDR